MTEAPTLVRYHPGDREEVFSFLREVYPLDVSARTIEQWSWKFEANPFTPESGPDVQLIRIGAKLVGISAGFWLRMWMAGVECEGECRASWLVHPDYRGRKLWQVTNQSSSTSAPVIFGWTSLPKRIAQSMNWENNPMYALVRVLRPGAMLAQFAHSRAPVLTDGALVRGVSAPARAIDSRAGSVVRLESFDARSDALWERARRSRSAMVVRNRQYLNWRYCQRPDATYLRYGLQRGDQSDAILVARIGEYRGMRWAYLVDFLAAENSSRAMRLLIRAAGEDFRRERITAVSCYATDPAVRRALFLSGFFPVPARKPIRFVHFIRKRRPDLARFRDIRSWYLTTGDGDFDMSF
jgi:hypothetical protein